VIRYPLLTASYESYLQVIKRDRFVSYGEAIDKYGAGEIWVEVILPEPIHSSHGIPKIVMLERDEEARVTLLRLQLGFSENCFGSFVWRYQ
jgi:hypothetical protein